MGAKKRSAPNTRKRSRPQDGETSNNNNNGTTTTTTTTTTTSNGHHVLKGNTKKKHHKEQTGILSGNALSQLKMGSVVLVIAILIGILWNYMDQADPRIRAFLSLACRRHYAGCARFVTPIRRTLQAARPIRQGETLVQIPRALQVWDIDAIQDASMTELGLLKARHPRSNNPLAAGAFLAAYLALQQQEQTLLQQEGLLNDSNNNDENNVINDQEKEKHPVKNKYLEILPNAEELKDHPIFWEKQELMDRLGGHSLNFAVALNYRDMVESEYNAFVAASSTFAEKVNETAYMTARVNVMTRSFSSGPKGVIDDEDLIEHYKTTMGIDFSKGCHAMVPILDLLNHHPNPNVIYSYNKEKQAFVISASKTIPAGWELMDSYGKFSDNHLFARFGFVQGDGSGHTQASIAIFHRNLDLSMRGEFSHLPMEGTTKVIQDYQRRDLSRYLQYDDGYTDCITGPDMFPREFRLKALKLEHLLRMANVARHWVVTIPPRNPLSAPVDASDIPIMIKAPELDPKKLRMDLTPLMETCRLMSLVTSDYDGRAIEVLKTNIRNETFVVERGNDALEYRALTCVTRLASTSLMQYSVIAKDELARITQLNQEEFQTREWTAAHLRLGEMQTLQAISGLAYAHATRIKQEAEDPDTPEFSVREHSCPFEYTEPLGQRRKPPPAVPPQEDLSQYEV